MVSPETEANSFTKAEKSIAVMPRAPSLIACHST
jgi:hypothetical protein